jgi:hypothetical protein
MARDAPRLIVHPQEPRYRLAAQHRIRGGQNVSDFSDDDVASVAHEVQKEGD